MPTRDIYPGTASEGIAVMRHGGGGEPARFICGFLHSDQRFDHLLNSLPPALCVRTRIDGLMLETPGTDGWNAQPISNPHEAGLWQSSLQYLIRETVQPGPGNRAVLARLSEFLFMEVLRWQLRTASESGSGWLAGLHDPHVGRALQLMHAQPARAWSVQDLAGQSALSRAALGRKFVELVGHSPMQYLAAWRMHLARNLLRESKLSVAEIAERVGYESEAAFSRTFSRVVGAPPAAWRRANIPASRA